MQIGVPQLHSVWLTRLHVGLLPARLVVFGADIALMTFESQPLVGFAVAMVLSQRCTCRVKLSFRAYVFPGVVQFMFGHRNSFVGMACVSYRWTLFLCRWRSARNPNLELQIVQGYRRLCLRF